MACTSCPPGACAAPGIEPAANSSGVRTSSTDNERFVSVDHASTCFAVTVCTLKRTSNFCAPACRPGKASLLISSGYLRVAPRSSSKSASTQPCVPFSRANTGFSMPKFRSVCAPMIERVRPAQFTMILVIGFLTISRMRNGNSAFGQQMPPGIFILLYSAYGRPSTITKSSLFFFICASSVTVTRGVSYTCSTSSPNNLLGTLTPLKIANPAAAHPGLPPPKIETSV